MPGRLGIRQKRAKLIVTGPRCAVIAGEETLDLREQMVRQMAFMHKTVGTVAAAFIGNGQTVELRKDDHPQVRTGEADLLCSLQSVDPRHAEIKKDKIGLALRCELHRVQAVTGCPDDLKPTGEFQVVTHRAKRCGGIVGNKDFNRFSGFRHFTWTR